MITKRGLIFLLFTINLIIIGCNPSSPTNINIPCGAKKIPGDVGLPVAFLVADFACQPQVSASGWLIEGSNGMLFSARHFSDVFMNSPIDLGTKECRAFMFGQVYNCVVVKVPPIRDAVLLKLTDFSSEIYKFKPYKVSPYKIVNPYKISTQKPKIGDRVFVQGKHLHPYSLLLDDRRFPSKNKIIPILEKFYGIRMVDKFKKQEVVFESLEGKVVNIDTESIINDPHLGEYNKKILLKYENESYIKIRTVKKHPLAFQGLSGGVVLNQEKEVIGIITAQNPFRVYFDTIYATPIESVKELYQYARLAR
jgi:hypothetical protein